MPSKLRERDRDRDSETPKSKERPRHRSSRRRSSTKDPEKLAATPERHSSRASLSVKHTSSMPVPEYDQPPSTASPHGSRTSLPYPSFSKAHSKEAVGSREEVVNPRLSYYTPDPTDLDRTKLQANEGAEPDSTGGAPPSPPLTTVEQVTKRDENATSTSPVEGGKDEDSPPTNPGSTSAKEPRQKKSQHTHTADSSSKVKRRRSDLQKAADEIKKRLQRGKSGTIIKGRSDRQPSTGSKGGQRESAKDEEKSPVSSGRSRTGTPSKTKPKAATIEEASSSTTLERPLSPIATSITETETPSESTIDSDATSIAPNQPSIQEPSTSIISDRLSSSTNPDSPSRTPPLHEQYIPRSQKTTPAFDVSDEYGILGRFDESPAPPPPPPPPTVPFHMPRVDYLIQNGGLSQNVPRTFLAAGHHHDASNSATSPELPLIARVESFFAPFNSLLDDYTKVISRCGSLAVATGYRSIARRLLDRLEVVFARDISSEICTCVMCDSSPSSNESIEVAKGVSWGEILEYVCGRQELPLWPAFVLDSTQAGLGISTCGHQAPMQHLDIDVPEEFRDHYVRQSKKTKQSVDRWLAGQPDSPTSPPQDVDDETLTFAMLTRLEPDQRPLFSSLVGVAPSRPPSRASASLMEPRSPLLERTGLAIQRLYHLSGPPRDPESAMYLLTNPDLHNVLATLAAVSDDEWEILTSGRFDGFLRSGAEDFSNPLPPQTQAFARGFTPTAQRNPSIPPSRGATPFSRGPTPGSATIGAPVSMDEETEIAVLAEIEREIFSGMEALEDGFEALHSKAEVVRRALRERGAGLSIASQTRQGSRDLDARLGTPASGGYSWESETDDGLDDGMSELAPDDSASSVSRSRNRRPKRRTERRTPALVEEDEESES